METSKHVGAGRLRASPAAAGCLWEAGHRPQGHAASAGRSPGAKAQAALQRAVRIVLLHAACVGAAAAADTTWTGSGAGPYWDDTANWSAGVPNSPAVDALLGSFDTTIRSGDYTAASLQGSGTLTLSGGNLLLVTPTTAPIALSRVVLHNGSYDGRGTGVSVHQPNFLSGSPLEIGRVDVTGVGLTVISAEARVADLNLGGGRLVVQDLLLSGRMQVAASIAALQVTRWRTQASSVVQDQSDFSYSVSASDWRHAGSYVKAGVGSTQIAAVELQNTGSIKVQAGKLALVPLLSGADWSSTGALQVTGGELSVDLQDGAATRLVLAGAVQADNGRLYVNAGYLDSSAAWRIGAGGTAEVYLWTRFPDRPFAAHLEAGSLHNDGLLELRGGEFTLPQAVSGGGQVELAFDARLLVQAGQQIAGSLDAKGVLAFDLSDPGSHDSLHLGGQVNLYNGDLELSFADGLVAGLYHLITADGGVVGYFDQVRAGLGPQADPAHQVFGDWRLDVIYGAHTVDLKVSLVPEPASLACMGLGLLAMVAARRRI